jgi:hypothetical protein
LIPGFKKGTFYKFKVFLSLIFIPLSHEIQLSAFIFVFHKDPVQLDAGPLPSSAWAGWRCFNSEMEVEAAKGELYRWPILTAVKLSSEVYASCGGGGLRRNVLYRGVHYTVNI